MIMQSIGAMRTRRFSLGIRPLQARFDERSSLLDSYWSVHEVPRPLALQQQDHQATLLGLSNQASGGINT